jgi:hypothetical protein
MTTYIRHTTAGLAVCIGIYLGALGPLSWLEWNGVALDSGLHHAAVVAYRPLNRLCERSEMISDLRNGWVRCWTTDAPL